MTKQWIIKQNRWSFFLSFLFFLLLSAFPFQTNLAAGDYTIEIYKSSRLLLLKKDNVLKKTFQIAVGSGGLGDKIRRGDNKTPIGSYRVTFFKENSDFHLFMQLNYPNAKDALHGLKNKIIDRKEFGLIINALKRKVIPNQETDLGGSIGIHGIGEENEEKLALHRDENWTQGCIAMRNDEIDQLRKFVHIGTPVIIFN